MDLYVKSSFGPCTFELHLSLIWSLHISNYNNLSSPKEWLSTISQHMKHGHFKVSVVSVPNTYRTMMLTRNLPIYIRHAETMLSFNNLNIYVSKSNPLLKSHKNRMQGSCPLSKDHKNCLLSTMSPALIKKTKKKFFWIKEILN